MALSKQSSVVRLSLKEWVFTEECRQQLKIAIDRQDVEATVSILSSYLSIMFPKEKFNFDKMNWEEVQELYLIGYVKNLPNAKFPILKSDSVSNPVFDYVGRNWYLWLNMLAKQYGWTREYIEKLEIDDAVGLLQEIMWDEQRQREWEWMQNENAYIFDKQTNRSTFKPYPRPKWMEPNKKTQEEAGRPEFLKVKIPAFMMPVGLVLNTPQDIANYDNKTSTYIAD